MTFLINALGTKSFGLFLMLLEEGKTSFGVYDVSRSLTPVGWAVIVILPTALIFGAIYLAFKIIKKPKLK